MRSFPFTNYDFFGYIASGFVFIFALDHLLGTGWMIRPSWTVVEGFFATACAYAVGHLLAGFSSALIERRFLRRWLGSPNLHLFGVERTPARFPRLYTLFRRLYPSYFEALPSATQARIRAKALADGCGEPGEAMFWLCFSTARDNKAAYRRMSDFLNNYGLCRNLSYTAVICVALLVVSAVYWHRWTDLGWAAAAVILSAGMLLRYLKFYRHYTAEVVTCYGHDKPKKAKARKTTAATQGRVAAE